MRKMTNDCPDGDQLLPEHIVGAFLPVCEDDVAVFNDILSDDIDSAFASSICCCDYCYEEFKGLWPDVAFRDNEFQCQSMSTRWLADYSRLEGIYNALEMSTLRHMVRCERCGATGPANVWIYEHPFSDVDGLEEAIGELVRLGSETPFLVLDHPFAQRVRAAIAAEAEISPRRCIGEPLFRARTDADVIRCGQDPQLPEPYHPPPAHLVAEGRFNHAGVAMLYLASREDVAAAEIGAEDEMCWVAEIRIGRDLKVLDLFDLGEEQPHFEIFRALARSALLSAPHTGTGWVRRQYVFSRFVADCAISAGFDAIRYGSIKNPSGSNYVILRPAPDQPGTSEIEAIRSCAAPAAARRY